MGNQQDEVKLTVCEEVWTDNQSWMWVMWKIKNKVYGGVSDCNPIIGAELKHPLDDKEINLFEECLADWKQTRLKKKLND